MSWLNASGRNWMRDTPAELRVGGLIHVTHATRSDVICDLVIREFGADHGVNEIWRRILSNNRM
jgi:hypothetical protein